MQNYQLLAWDSEMLNIPTAKILPEKLTAATLTTILRDLKAQKIGLVFWASDSTDEASQVAAQECEGFLADRKVTYAMNLNNFKLGDQDLMVVESYLDNLPTAEMHHLALEIAAFSRFGTDPKISKQQMKHVYKTWVENSTKRQIAKEVLVIRKNGKVVGMSTLGEKNQRGDIGLLAVDPNCRGLNLGSTLVTASQQWCVNQGYAWGQVVTQMDNNPACKLYEKCGYHQDKIEHFYHFWL